MQSIRCPETLNEIESVAFGSSPSPWKKLRRFSESLLKERLRITQGSLNMTRFRIALYLFTHSRTFKPSKPHPRLKS